MAVYRSDQAQLTFGPEAAHGGYPEAHTTAPAATSGDAGAGLIDLAAGYPAGTRQIIIDGVSGDSEFVAGDYIQIGQTSGETVETEVRRIEYVDETTPSAGHSTLTLDMPTAFFHADDEAVTIITGVTDYEGDKFMTWVPGVYETVEVPDPEMAIEGRYLLGIGQKRNFFVAYKGQQTFAGSVGGFVLLNGWPLRFAIGSVNSIPVGGTITTRTDIVSGSDAKKGDYCLNVDDQTNMTPGNIITIDYDATPDITKKSEIRRVVARAGSSGAGIIRLNYPLQYDHAALGSSTQIRVVTGSPYYRHDIYEQIDLDSIAWHIHMSDSGETTANDFDRRYAGGHVGSMSVNAEEGGLLTASWDGVTFKDMVHNQKLTDSGTFAETLPNFTHMHSIDENNIGYPYATTGGFPTADPYYFSQGSLTMFGVEFARVRSFNLSVSNGEEPRYYISNQGKGTHRHRGPSEIREQQREYSMSASIALPDSTISATDTARKIFTELILEGDYGLIGGASSMRGFAVTLVFTRGANDTITFTIPGASGTGSTSGTAAAGGGKQGAFIRSAPHAISGDNPLQVDVDILFRNLDIQIKDSEPYYP